MPVPGKNIVFYESLNMFSGMLNPNFNYATADIHKENRKNHQNVFFLKVMHFSMLNILYKNNFPIKNVLVSKKLCLVNGFF